MIKDFSLIKCPTCENDTSILEISKLLKKQGAKEIIVLDNYKPVGVITLTDIVYKAVSLNKDLKKLKAKEISTKDIFYLDENEDELKAYMYMLSKNHLFCPITSKGKFVGLLGISQILKNRHKK